VGARLAAAEADIPLAGVEDDEIVAQAVHFDERKVTHKGCNMSASPGCKQDSPGRDRT
jgi:hypothetical protein